MPTLAEFVAMAKAGLADMLPGGALNAEWTPEARLRFHSGALVGDVHG